MSLNIVVAGLPKAVQGASDPVEGIWLTEQQRARILAVADDVWLEHIPVSNLNGGLPPQRPPHAIMVETSGTVESIESEVGILTQKGYDQLINPDLQLIQSMSAGAEHLTTIVPQGVVLANASGVAAKAIAETVIGAILADAKMLHTRWQNQAARKWVELPARELDGAVMTILGTGNIGSQTARIASALGIRTIGINRQGNEVRGFDEVVSTGSLLDALATSDFLVIAAPLTPQTRGLIDARAIAAMKPGGWIANVARGPIHDAGALVAALEDGHLRGALIDCHAMEPLPADDPLWTAPGALVLPHDSHASQLLGDRQVDLFVDNLRRLGAAQPFRNVVDLDRGY
ncbi:MULTISPECIES: D-2-hydroxyacid dehydrogenase [unclassified Gordonia (in: high G+C Gram-positive bacteria)]|uniref:D-2-hydroxyacid dehydrogenase n=1 Tax=unclassified Gordonia (in: high G+C Gram-positive bacteria) TaxID=2657482 RepID=UPI0010F847F9|nr:MULTISPECIES: D-2-hydroxyacid dehydrogenase [unclassified Gordonia (in: high G+C Gram-positive bacteria)]